jgi:hypothetical protein
MRVKLHPERVAGWSKQEIEAPSWELGFELCEKRRTILLPKVSAGGKNKKSIRLDHQAKSSA